jgi:hypothetical protein
MSKLVSNKELIYSNMLQLEAIIRLLERNNLVSGVEIIEEVENLKMEMEAKIRKGLKFN